MGDMHWWWKFGDLGVLYWRLRDERRLSRRRRYWYRRIVAERSAIVASGVDAELVRLYCRHLANPSMASTYERFMSYAKRCGMMVGPTWG